MKTHSIQFKFLTTIISAMLAITVFVGGLSIYEVDKFVQYQTENFINVTCEKEAAQMNDIFGDMEKSVNLMGGYVLDFVGSMADIEDREKRDEIIRYADRMFADVANYTAGTVAYYIRFAPEISDSQTGFFYSKIDGSEEYIRFEPTNLALYDKDDTERVGWYWQPYEAKKPVWIEPYYNKNNDIMMISYVVPLYCEKQFIGVVGMDFDYNALVEKVHNIKIYENGFAHLEIDGVAIHSSENEFFSYEPENYLQVSAGLINEMTLVLSASYDDIRQIRYEIALQILVTVLVLAAVFCLITIMMVGKIVNPLKKLTDASKKLADGDYDVDPICSDTYEIQLLSIAFQNMAKRLREHEKLQHLLAYRDSLTGLRNTTSYKAWITDFEKEVQKNNADYGVIVLDVNYLKEINDRYGHDTGNKLIVAAARIISTTFKRSTVFRIGGDEFLVILQNSDLANYEELCEKFDMECTSAYIEENGEHLPISIARGFARYDLNTDVQYADVFKRADDEMYVHKRKMKESQALRQFFREKNRVQLQENEDELV